MCEANFCKFHDFIIVDSQTHGACRDMIQIIRWDPAHRIDADLDGSDLESSYTDPVDGFGRVRPIITTSQSAWEFISLNSESRSKVCFLV